MKQVEQAVGCSVSRETSQKLRLFEELINRWNPGINLVAKSTLGDLEARHFADSAQLLHIHPMQHVENWLDLGSGGGFPGLVVAILAAEKHPDLQVTLVESDRRKAAFLRTVVRETELKTRVISDRIENLERLNADILSARALAPLPALLAMVKQHLASEGIALLPKGRDWKREIEDSRKLWHFLYHPHTSITNPESVILEVRELSHV